MEKVIIDIDGTLISGDREINNSPSFIRHLKSTNTEFLLSTNSIKSHLFQKTRLSNIGIEVSEKQIFTPIDSINQFIIQYGFKEILTIGTEEEINQISANQNETNPELVILLDFEKSDYSCSQLQQLIDLIENGCQIISASKSSFYQQFSQIAEELTHK